MAEPEGSEKAMSDYELVDFEEPYDSINEFEDDTNNQSDGSYEFVNSEEVRGSVIQKEEDISADYYQNNIPESPDMETDEEYFENNVPESPNIETDEEYYENTDTESPDTETDDGSKKGEIIKVRTAADLKKLFGNLLVYPENIKQRSTMKLKDVVKVHVLPFLPAKSLIKFRAVSTEWDKWISSPFLAHMQSNNFQKISGLFLNSPVLCTFISLDHCAYGVPSSTLSFIPGDNDIKSSCNGLLLCRGSEGEKSYYICNPTNKEWKSLPEPKYYHGDETKCVLVFDPSPLNFAEDFQVICAVTLTLPLPPYEMPVMYFEIYDSKTRSWRLSDVICVELGDSVLTDDGFYWKGIAYWKTSGNELLAFDLKNGICGLQPLPNETKCIGVLDGEICYITAHYECETFKSIMKIKPTLKIYGDYLVLKRTIQLGGGNASGLNKFHLLSTVGNDFAETFLEETMIANNLKGRKVTGVGVDARYFPYVNSIVSLEHH